MLSIIAGPAGAADFGQTNTIMINCINHEAGRIEKLQDDLESVGKIIVNVVCLPALKDAATSMAVMTTGQNPPSNRDYNAAREFLLLGYEVQAITAAISARESRLSGRN